MSAARRALVTGASGGLGAAIATALAGRGHDVAVHYRSDQAGAERVADAVRATGRRAAFCCAGLDVEDPDELDRTCEDLLTEAEDRLGGPVDVLVLNASGQDLAPWDQADTSHWDRMWRDTLRHQTALLHAFTAQPDGRTGAVVVTIGSIEGLRASHDHTAYAVLKAALHHLTAAAAHELGAHGIRVVGVAPGLIDREGLARDWPDGVSRWRAASALGRPVTPQEVAAAVAFLASPDASGITGVTLPVDAGWSASPGW